MFKFQILATTNDKPRPSVIALTHYRDLAEFIAEHAAGAIDPGGKMEMQTHIIERAEADCFAYRPRSKREE